MISVCCCAMNAKWDVEVFARSLARHNQGVDFELLIAHDDRVNDGSGQYFTQLQKEIPQLKVVTHTKQDTIDYLNRVLNYYDSANIMQPSFRSGLRENLKKYEQGTLFDETKSFLWLSSGILYNKAVRASSGDVIIVTPGDFLYLFSLRDAENFAKSHSRHGYFYTAPNALFARLTNQDRDWLIAHMNRVHNGQGFREGYRWDSTELFRDYLRGPSKLEDLYIPDFKRPELISLAREDFCSRMQQFCYEFASFNGGMQYLQEFHGYHIMTRQTYNAVGGFTEEYFGRAFPDDKMTALGKKTHYIPAPQWLTVAWCGQHEVLPYHGAGYSPGWEDKLKEIDPLWDQHPLPSRSQPTYLWDGLATNSRMHDIVCQSFNRLSGPVRIAT